MKQLILNCPFCGSEAGMRIHEDWKVICTNFTKSCPIVSTNWYETEEKAIATWNTRIGPERGKNP